MDTAPAKVQHVTKSSSDELLRKFAQVGSESEDKAAAKRELQLAKRRLKRIRTATQERDGQLESPSSRRASLGERKSLLPPAAASRRSSALVRRLGIGRSRLTARDLKKKSILGAIEKTWRKTVEGASKVFLEKHYNRHKRLINDVA